MVALVGIVIVAVAFWLWFRTKLPRQTRLQKLELKSLRMEHEYGMHEIACDDCPDCRRSRSKYPTTPPPSRAPLPKYVADEYTPEVVPEPFHAWYDEQKQSIAIAGSAASAGSVGLSDAELIRKWFEQHKGLAEMTPGETFRLVTAQDSNGRPLLSADDLMKIGKELRSRDRPLARMKIGKELR